MKTKNSQWESFKERTPDKVRDFSSPTVLGGVELPKKKNLGWNQNTTTSQQKSICQKICSKLASNLLPHCFVVKKIYQKMVETHQLGHKIPPFSSLPAFVFLCSPRFLGLFHQIGATKMRQGRHGPDWLVDWVDGNNLVGEFFLFGDSMVKMVSTLLGSKRCRSLFWVIWNDFFQQEKNPHDSLLHLFSK